MKESSLPAGREEQEHTRREGGERQGSWERVGRQNDKSKVVRGSVSRGCHGKERGVACQPGHRVPGDQHSDMMLLIAACLRRLAPESKRPRRTRWRYGRYARSHLPLSSGRSRIRRLDVTHQKDPVGLLQGVRAVVHWWEQLPQYTGFLGREDGVMAS